MPARLEKTLSDDLNAYIRKLVDQAPSLTEERRSRITALFRAGAA